MGHLLILFFPDLDSEHKPLVIAHTQNAEQTSSDFNTGSDTDVAKTKTEPSTDEDKEESVHKPDDEDSGETTE